MFIKETSLVIPTKDRREKLKKFIISIEKYVNEFKEILIVDSSQVQIHQKIAEDYLGLQNVKIYSSRPSTSLQRNIGIKNSSNESTFIMFCDDDIIFEENALRKMNDFINNNHNYIGYGYNLIEKKKITKIENLKKNKLLAKYGFYHFKPGIVCENGWHTKITNLQYDCETNWLSTQACLYRKKTLNSDTLFNLKLGQYSYLEDLFFSYNLSKRGKLIVSSRSTYKHENNVTRTGIKFGIIEVTNRYNFVKENKLSKKKFYITIFIKTIQNFLMIFLFKLNFFKKFLGNLVGIILCIIK